MTIVADHLSDDVLSALLDAQLPTDEERVARAHLDACPTCARRLGELQSVVSLLRGLPELEPARDFTLGPRLVAAPINVVRLERWYAWTRAAAASLAAVFVLLVGGSLYVGMAQSTSTPRAVELRSSAGVANQAPVSSPAPAAARPPAAPPAPAAAPQLAKSAAEKKARRRKTPPTWSRRQPASARSPRRPPYLLRSRALRNQRRPLIPPRRCDARLFWPADWPSWLFSERSSFGVAFAPRAPTSPLFRSNDPCCLVYPSLKPARRHRDGADAGADWRRATRAAAAS